MAAEILPIELGLTAGNVLTLWAPEWREDGEDWEAFLGSGDDLFVFPTAAHLAAFVRTAPEHDLLDHPEWTATARLLTDELVPDDDHRFDIVGVPDLVAEPPDIWTLAELADTVAILRSVAEVCDLGAIDEVLGAADGFALLSAGEQAFTGRPGEKLWDDIGAVVSERWDEVVDALDGIVTTPPVDQDALAVAQAEAKAVEAVSGEGAVGGVSETGEEDEERDEDLAFWDETGVDCLEIIDHDRSGWTLRCYLDDEPLFLSREDRILIFADPAGLEDFLTDGAAEHSLTSLAVWPEIQTAIVEGNAAVAAGPENTYLVSTDRPGDLTSVTEGVEAVDRQRLELTAELLTDAAAARGDDESLAALSTSSPLGNLISALIRPEEDRLPPAPPYDEELASWGGVIERFRATLDWQEQPAT